ncbi:MAG: phosphoglycolate phosphatase [Campylobacterales bacterium]|nr:phosphoglycolate phosphatase [Campylobacterales bacterium]
MKKLTNKQLLLFDLDGTLIDSAPDLANALNLTLQQLGKRPFTLEVIRGWVGNGAQTLVHRALSGSRSVDSSIDSNLIKTTLKTFLNIYEQNLCNTTKLYDGVQETLQSLNEKYIMCVVTNKPHRFIQPILETLQIDQYFLDSIGGDFLETKKPDPDQLLYITNKHQYQLDNCVMIGDSKNDIFAARNCDMTSIAVTYGYNYDQPVSDFNPDYIVNTFKEINTLL